jgi:hypothetical protein
LFFQYHEGVSIDLRAAKQIVEERTRFLNHKYYPLVTDIRGVRYFEKSARDYFALEGTHLIKCAAVLVESPISKLMAKFYISVNKPVLPTRIFTDMDDALEFARHFLPEDDGAIY